MNSLIDLAFFPIHRVSTNRLVSLNSVITGNYSVDIFEMYILWIPYEWL